MMMWLRNVSLFATRPWFYAGGALLVIALLAGAYAFGASRGRAEMRPQIERLAKDLATAENNVSVLETALATQSAAVEAAGRERDRVRREIERVKRQAQDRKPPAILKELRQAKDGETPCPVAPINRQAWEMLQ